MGRKKKTNTSSTATTATTATTTTSSIPQHHVRNGGGGETTPTPTPTSTKSSAEPTRNLLLRRAQELKEEGNRLFQLKDYTGALHHYDLALNLTPTPHPDRAVFHSNRAACLLLMPPPVDHRAVVQECSLALQSQPNYPRALLRRARSFDALGDPLSALSDVHSLLQLDPSNRDALDLARRLRLQINTTKSTSTTPNGGRRPSPAALGASAVGTAPIAGLGPCLPSRKKTSSPPPEAKSKPNPPPISLSSKPLKLEQTVVTSPPPPPPVTISSFTSPISCNPPPPSKKVKRTRPLKLVYDHDIRLASMPSGCSFRSVREIVRGRFPCSKAVLVKYRDPDGDLVTITSTGELRMAESYADEGGDEKKEKLALLRLHIVEVKPEQEPEENEEDGDPKEGEEEEEVGVSDAKEGEEEEEEVGVRGAECSMLVSNAVENGGGPKNETMGSEVMAKVKVEGGGHKSYNHQECKEIEIDDWLFEFAQLFRTQVGVDPDAHLDLHELGNELCSEALEETVTSEEAQMLFEMAAAKFQEVAALAYFNWGNVHMCSARKKMAIDESAPKDVMAARLQSAYDWIKERYNLAGCKYEEALRIKPDFYEGLLALGQQHFEMAKLQWSFALASKVDLVEWDSKDTLGLFDSAEEKMKAATDIWEKLEEQRAGPAKDPLVLKREELLKRRRKQDATASGGQASSNLMVEVSPEEAAEQAAAMRSQIHLFWGNMLFERSQVEFKLGTGRWKSNFDDAIERFKLAGASEADISIVIKNHSSNEASTGEVDEKKVITTIATIADIVSKDEEEKHVVDSSSSQR